MSFRGTWKRWLRLQTRYVANTSGCFSTVKSGDPLKVLNSSITLSANLECFSCSCSFVMSSCWISLRVWMCFPQDCIICMERLTSPSGYEGASEGPQSIQPSAVGKLTKCGHALHMLCMLAMYNNGNKVKVCLFVCLKKKEISLYQHRFMSISWPAGMPELSGLMGDIWIERESCVQWFLKAILSLCYIEMLKALFSPCCRMAAFSVLLARQSMGRKQEPSRRARWKSTVCLNRSRDIQIVEQFK